MTRRLLALAMLGAGIAVAADVQDVQAFGKKSRGGCATTAVGCGYEAQCGPSYTVAYVDQEVKGLKAVPKSKKVEVDVVEYKMVEEKFDYYVNTMVPDKQKIKVCKIVENKIPTKYVTYEMKQVPDTVKVCKTDWKPEPYTYYEPVMTKVPQKRIVYNTVCVPTPVTCQVPVYMPACGPCGGCGSVCYTTVTHTVMKPTCVPTEVWVDTWQCVPTKRDGVRQVPVHTWVDQPVMVWKCVPVPHDGFRIECIPTWVDQDVDVMVCKPVKHEGKHMVCKPFPGKQWVEHHWCEYEPTVTVVKVPVLVPCAAPAPAPCATPYAGYGVGCGGISVGCGGCR